MPTFRPVVVVPTFRPVVVVPTFRSVVVVPTFRPVVVVPTFRSVVVVPTFRSAVSALSLAIARLSFGRLSAATRGRFTSWFSAINKQVISCPAS